MSGSDDHRNQHPLPPARLAFSAILAGVLALILLSAAQAQGTTPVPVPIQGRVTLQRPNSPPPSEPWVVPLVVTFYPPGESTPVGTYLATTDLNGHFVVTPTLVISDAYDVRVKNFHTLRNVKRNVVVYPDMTLDMGTLLEGDANDDNRVRISDFAILRNAYFTDEGDPGFDPRADFDEDNKIRIRDFALLRSNYFATGDIEVSTTPASERMMAVPNAGVDFAVVPARQQVNVGDTVTVTLVADADGQPIVGVDVRLTFDATRLQGIRSTPGPAFDLILQNTLEEGQLSFSAATFGQPVSGRLNLVTLTLKALSPTPGTVLHLTEVDATDEAGRSVVGNTHDGTVQIGASFKVLYLPLLMR